MKSSKKNFSSVFKWPSNFLIMLLAITVASSLWYFVRKKEIIEAQLEVSLDYNGIPSNLVVIKGLESRVKVRLRGPETLLRATTPERLKNVIDLSHIKKGYNLVPLGKESLGPDMRAFDLVDISPTRLEIEADSIMEKSVPIRTEVKSPLQGNAIAISNAVSKPGTVILKGPESVISGINYLEVPIRVDPKNTGTKQAQRVTLDTPNFVTASPPTVEVTYDITSGRATITRDCAVVIAGDSANNYKVKPETVMLKVEVPEALARNTSYLKQLQVQAVPPALQVGESERIKLRVRMPEGMIQKEFPQLDAVITRVRE